jgi:hypothetical protein
MFDGLFLLFFAPEKEFNLNNALFIGSKKGCFTIFWSNEHHLPKNDFLGFAKTLKTVPFARSSLESHQQWTLRIVHRGCRQ